MSIFLSLNTAYEIGPTEGHHQGHELEQGLGQGRAAAPIIVAGVILIVE